MTPTVEFDPATLAIWTTTGTLLPEVAEPVAAAISAAVRGEDPRLAMAGLPEGDPLRRRAMWLSSCVWHEKRHFFDICLTNYGARRFREPFILAANFLPLAAEAAKKKEPVWFPVEVYRSSVHRRIFGISEPAPNIVQIAEHARAMKRLSAALDQPPKYRGQVIHLGGNAQLEGLAQVSQTHAIEHRFGFDEAVEVTAEHTNRLPREGPYRAIESVAGALGCFKEIGTDAIILNVGLASALFLTALSGRFFGVGKEGPDDLVSPWLRLAKLIEALGPSPGNFEMSDEAAWDLVDSTARRLWGRTALDEIEADIEAMDTASGIVSQPWMAHEGMADAYVDFVALRKRLVASVRSQGSASMSPRAFPLLWLDQLLPWHIVATPRGSQSDIGDAPVVFGVKLNVPGGLERLMPSEVAWGRLHEIPATRAATGFALSDRAAWIQMAERHAPRARLMLNGRRYRRMVPPELERPISELGEWNLAVRFDPNFEWPESRDQATRRAEARELADWMGLSTFVCDVTGEKIAVEQAMVVTPWEFRRSPLVQRYREFMGSPEIMADLQLEIDWSDWVVRCDLLPD
jgi:hypothetical protein